MSKSSQSWKKFERYIAGVLGGQRRGAYTGSGGHGKTDIIHEHWGVECKLLKSPTYAALMDACLQAERNSEPGQCPIAIVKRKNDADGDALVVMRLDMFWRHFARELTKLMKEEEDRKSTRLNSSHSQQSRMPSSA